MARAYAVMDRVVVEVSCVHSADPATSHLVIREERGPYSDPAEGYLRALSEVCQLAEWSEQLVCPG